MAYNTARYRDNLLEMLKRNGQEKNRMIEEDIDKIHHEIYRIKEEEYRHQLEEYHYQLKERVLADTNRYLMDDMRDYEMTRARETPETSDDEKDVDRDDYFERLGV